MQTWQQRLSFHYPQHGWIPSNDVMSLLRKVKKTQFLIQVEGCSRKEGNVLFNDGFNTLYLRLDIW